MALGYCEALLVGLDAIAKENAPEMKITPTGFLRGLAENTTAPEVIESDNGQGHRRDVRIKYLQRATPTSVQDTDSCDIDAVPLYNEVTFTPTKFAKKAIYVNDKDIARYCADASQYVSAGSQPQASQFMRDHLKKIMTQWNAMYGKMDMDLLTAQSLNFGVNVNTGDNLTKIINISKDRHIQDLNEGLTDLLRDYEENEGMGSPWIVGNGLFHAYSLQQFAKGLDQAGVNTSLFERDYKFYYDRYTISKFGANQIAVMQPDAVHFVGVNKYEGNFAGQKGNSLFGTIVDPRMAAMGAIGAEMGTWDFQFKYFDCPFTADVDGSPTTLDRGYALILSKTYDLFNIPTNAYDPADILTGNNGTLRYTITNDCATC